MYTNHVIETILARRSIRAFLPQNLEPEKREALLACATAAPSARNLHPCRFLVLEEGELRQRIAAAVPNQGVLFDQAPLVIALWADLREYPSESVAWLEDCSAAAENILIAAKSMGLETLWYGVHRRETKEKALREVLEVPPGAEIHSLIVVGYGNETKPPREKTDTERVRYGLGNWF